MRPTPRSTAYWETTRSRRSPRAPACSRCCFEVPEPRVHQYVSNTPNGRPDPAAPADTSTPGSGSSVARSDPATPGPLTRRTRRPDHGSDRRPVGRGVRHAQRRRHTGSGRSRRRLVGDGVTPSNWSAAMRCAGSSWRRQQRSTASSRSIVDRDRDGDSMASRAASRLPSQADGLHRAGRRRVEEERFSSTLDAVSGSSSSPPTRRSRGQASTLAATYGFPVELTLTSGRGARQAVDVDATSEMERHRVLARRRASELQRAADFARAAGFGDGVVVWARRLRRTR